MRERDGQRGIVIGPILFLIAIIGVLAAAIAAGAGSFTGSSSKSGAKVLASAIIDYANTVQIGVDRVLANGCDETEISFENPIISGYTNPNAPADKSCHVFDLNGGGIVWKNPATDIFSAIKTGPSNGLWVYRGDLCVGGVGSATRQYYSQGGTCRSDASPTSLVMVTHDIKPSVCDALNTMLGVELLSSGHNDSSGVWVNALSYFKGSYTKDATGGYDARATIGKRAGCARVNGGYTYFYTVLLPR